MRYRDPAGAVRDRVRRRGHGQHVAATRREAGADHERQRVLAGRERQRADYGQERRRGSGVARQLAEQDDDQRGESEQRPEGPAPEPREPRRQPIRESRSLDGVGQGQAAAEQHDDSPRNALRRRPVERELALPQRDRRQEQPERSEHGDPRVADAVDPAFEDRTRDPPRGGQQEGDGDDPLPKTHPPQRGDLAVDERASPGQLAPLHPEHDPHQHEIGEGKRDQGERNPDRHPACESDLDAIALEQERRRERIGRCPNQCRHSTDAGAERDRRDEGGGEAARVPLAADAIAELEHGDPDGQKQERGRSVADPHAEEGGAREKSRHEPSRRGPQRADDPQREPSVEPPPLHRRGQQKAAEEQEDDGIGVRRRGLPDRSHSEQGEESQRQETGGRDRDRLADPEDRHRRGAGRRPPCRGAEPLGGGERQDEQERERRGEDADPTAPRPRDFELSMGTAVIGAATAHRARTGWMSTDSSTQPSTW